MANSYIPRWQNISVNFNDANSMMNAAMGGISKAGTVFSKLRDDIAAEEQRAAEAAYKQQVFDENVRQFEAQQLWNREKAIADREHDKAMADLRQKYELAQIDQRHKNALEIETNKRQRYSTALTLGSTTYADRIKAGDTPAQALDAANATVRNAGFGDLKINAMEYVPTGDKNVVAGMLTPEYQAVKATENLIKAGALALDAKGKETAYNEYTDIFSRLRSGDDGSQGIIDANTGELRPLTVEEQDYLNKAQNLQVADIMQTAPETIKALRQEAVKSGLSVPDAEQIGLRHLKGIGREELYREQALLRGADPSKVIPIDTANAANEERKNLAVLEEVKRKAEADARTNSKTSSYNKSFTEFLDNFKIAGKDGKATLHGVDPKTVAEVQTVQEQFMNFGIGDDQFKIYLKLKANDIRYNEAHTISSSNQAEQFAKNLIDNVPKSGTGGAGNNGTGNTGNGADKITKIGDDKKAPKADATDILSKTGVTTELDKDILDNLGDVLEHRKNRLSRYTNASGGMNNYTRIQFGNPEKAYADMQAEVSNMERILKALANNEQITWNDEAVQVVLKNLQKERKDAINKANLYGTTKYRNRLQRINAMIELFKKD